MNRKKLIDGYLKFFESKGHEIIPSSPLIPENDPTVLFTTAGMHPLVPFLTGQPHPLGKRLCDVQKCIRTGDIEEVGDEYHHTFFEMLGNWSLGDYFKKEAIELSFEFLTKILKIPKEKIFVTCFAGDKDAAKDTEASGIWKSLGIKSIKFLPKEDNWWGPAGKTGPCGPDTEMFVNNTEIWNDVFMQYNKTENGKYIPLSQKNVDTGMGVERTISILTGTNDDYKTECFKPIIEKIEKLSGRKYGKEKNITRSMRIIADHIKASVFILAEGIEPSNTEQGYVLRRLIRRAVRYGKDIGMNKFATDLVAPVFEIYKEDYPELKKNESFIRDELAKEEERFEKCIEEGLKLSEKIFESKTPINKKKFSELMKDQNKSILIGRLFELKRNKKNYSLKNPKIAEQEIDKATITGKDSFLLYQSYGFPLEMINELAMSKGLLVDHNDFKKELEKHQELSRTASAGRFKSGLADKSKETTRLHTATHLLLAALKTVLKDENIMQKGSNITSERLRFDFSFPRQLTKEEIKDIEDLVNAQIQNSCEVCRKELTLEEAKKKGATGVFEKKYGEKVSVYIVGDEEKPFSMEICAGPHVKNTCELGKFKILKEESSSSGVRRIKAVLK